MNYAENPNLDLQVVETVTGIKEYRTNCRKIKGKFYIKDKDCFFVNGTWYRLETGKLEFDHESKKYVIKDETFLKHGIVSFENDEPVFGFFSQNPYTNCRIELTNGDRYECISYKIIPKIYNDLYSSMFVSRSKRQSSQTVKNTEDYRKYTYNIEDDAQGFEERKELYKNSIFPIKKELFKYQKALAGQTFGIEIEAIAGGLPTYVLNQCGVQICRDGSLGGENGEQGPEYVTVPMSGAKGLQNIINLSKEIGKRNTLNYNCSVHIHFGNIRKDRSFLIALYKAAVSIQNDMFKMFPFYKNDEIKYAGKQKNYCKKLKNIISNYEGSTKEDYETFVNSSYRTLFGMMIGNSSIPNFDINRTNGVHPQKNKWERLARYHWINFMNMFFGQRNTIEFRLHTPTFNSQKIINWLFICSAIIQYVEYNTERIIKGEKIKLKDVFFIYEELYGDKELSEYLFQYYNERVSFFKELTKNEDYIPNKELTEDSMYHFDSVLKDLFN